MKIKWDQRDPDSIALANVGNVTLRCYRTLMTNGESSWWAVVAMIGTIYPKSGPYCNSLSGAKEDAVRLAKELLLDFQLALDVEMNNFEMTYSDDT